MKRFPGALETALLKFLKLVARTLLRAGVGYKEFEFVAKRAFVAVAASEFGVRGRETNTSRIAVMTGLTRKEVTKLRNATNLEAETEMSPALVLSRWYTDEAFLDATGNPIPLSMTGSDPNFTMLVSRSTRDLPAGAVRVELERVGAIGETETGELFPLGREYTPIGEAALVRGFGRSLSFLMSSIGHNLDPRNIEALRPERIVFSPGMPADRIDEIRSRMFERIIEFTEEIDDWFATEQEAAETPERPTIGVGVYYFEEGTSGKKIGH